MPILHTVGAYPLAKDYEIHELLISRYFYSDTGNAVCKVACKKEYVDIVEVNVMPNISQVEIGCYANGNKPWKLVFEYNCEFVFDKFEFTFKEME